MNVDHSFRSLCDCVDVDEEFLETLIPYLDKLILMGVNLADLSLQQAIEGNIHHLESACRSLIGYAGWRAYQGISFESETHATYCFIKALIERWEPHPKWDQYSKFVAQARFLSPYEKARFLIQQLNTQHNDWSWNSESLYNLADSEIEALIPILQKRLISLQPN